MSAVLNAGETESLERDLRAQLRYLHERTPFYRRTWSGIDLDGIVTLDDLQRLPMVEKDEIRQSQEQAPPLGEHLGAPFEDVVQIQATSGSSGRPIYIGLTAVDLASWKEMGGRMLAGGGVRRGDVCLHAFGMSRGFVGGLPVAQMLEWLGVCVVPMGADSGLERMENVIRDVRPTAMLSTPSYALYLGEQTASWRRELGVGLRSLLVGGEPGGGIPSMRARLDELWGTETREIMGCSDVGSGMWAECEARDGMHYVAGDWLVVELVDADGRQLAPEPGTTGELVYTTLGREACGAVRFRSRDVATVTGAGCACGDPTVKIRCVGRSDDMIIVRGVNVYPTALQDIVAGLGEEVSGLVQVVKDFPGVQTDSPLRVRVEAAERDPGARRTALEREVQERIERGLACRVAVELVPQGTLTVEGGQKAALVVREEPVA